MILHYSNSDLPGALCAAPNSECTPIWDEVTCLDCIMHESKPRPVPSPFRYLNLSAITRDLVPIKSWRYKLWGKNSNGNPVAFTPDDRNRIADTLLILAARIRSGACILLITALFGCGKDIDQPQGEIVILSLRAANYDRWVTLVIDTNCQSVAHMEVKVLAGETVARGVWTDPNCKPGPVRFGSSRRI